MEALLCVRAAAADGHDADASSTYVHREGPNNEAIACIECQNDAKFTIRFCVKQMNDLEVLGFFIYADG